MRSKILKNILENTTLEMTKKYYETLKRKNGSYNFNY